MTPKVMSEDDSLSSRVELVDKPIEHQQADDQEAASLSQKKEVLDEHKGENAQDIVKKHTLASLSLGLVPVPILDVTALTLAQSNMLKSLSSHYDIPFNDLDIKLLITTTLGGSLPVLGGIGVASVVKIIPGVGSVLGSASLSVLSGGTTYAIGQVFISHFASGGTMNDLDSKQVQQLFQRELIEGKMFAQKLMEEQQVLKRFNVKETFKKGFK
jgi:uncharacterized protein (DUF697 family)